MKNKFIFILIILLIFGAGIYVLKNNTPSSDNSQQSLQQTSQIPPEVQEIRNRNEQLKKEKPYLFMGPEELSKYDCPSIADPKEKKLCTDIQENYKVGQLLKGLTQEQILNYDCTKIQDKTLITRCNDYIKFTKEMSSKMKDPGTQKNVPNIK